MPTRPLLVTLALAAAAGIAVSAAAWSASEGTERDISLRSGEAVFAAREAGVVAGLGVAAVTFFMLGADARITDRVPDGTRVARGDVVMRITGLTQRMLVAERTALNFMQRLSGIATLTRRYVDAAAGTSAPGCICR